MALDRKSEASFSAIPLYLCHGGSHTFTLKAEEHSPWINQGVSLNNPPGSTLPLSASPAVGVLHKFEEGGAVWTINCPPKGPDSPVEALQFWVQTEYTSPACKVDASLGHHRLVLDDVIGGEQFQVLEYGEQAELEVLESSYYTKGAAGVSALWKLGDREIKWAEPDADGWVRHTFIPPAAGVHALSVTAPSLYYEQGEIRKEVSVHALTLTPWGNDAVLELNGEPVVDVIDRGLVFTRGKSYPLSLLNENLLLKDSTLTLNSNGDPTTLGLSFDPDLGMARTMEAKEMPWSISSSPGNHTSGLFTFKVACSKLKKDWDVTAHLISESMADEVARVEVNDLLISELGAIFFREDTRPLTVTFEPGMRGLWVALEEVGEPALGMKYSPALKTLVQVPESLKLSWQVTGGESTGIFWLQIVCPDVSEPFGIKGRVVSRIAAEEIESLRVIDVSLDLEKPEPKFYRNSINELTLKVKPESALIGMKVALIAVDGNPDLGMSYVPALGESNARVIPASGKLEWTVNPGKDKSGFFGLQLRFIEVDAVLPLVCRLLSENVSDEVTRLEVDGKVVTAPLVVFLHGKTHQISVTFQPWMQGLKTYLNSDRKVMVSNPPLMESVEIPDDLTVNWQVNNTGVSTFNGVTVNVRGDRAPIVEMAGMGMSSRHLSENLLDEIQYFFLNKKSINLSLMDLGFDNSGKNVIELQFKGATNRYGALQGIGVVLEAVDDGLGSDLVFEPPLGEVRYFSNNHYFQWRALGVSQSSSFNLKLRFIYFDAEYMLHCRQLP